MRLVLAFFVFAAIVLLSFFIWGDALMKIFSLEGSVAWLEMYGNIAWLAGIFLLISDIFLPLPATLIMAALGYLYGPFAGSLISILGSFLSGALGYWMCRSLGERTARKILGVKDFERGIRLSGGIGAWVVVLSRWLPVFPEVVACMAGLTRMNALRFHLALLTGTVPLSITYAYIGYSGNQSPVVALVLSAALPPVIWLLATWLLKFKKPQSHG
jgi:uncharacterized membrane protein YdjX (TVP38/TMEM64 family)